MVAEVDKDSSKRVETKHMASEKITIIAKKK